MVPRGPRIPERMSGAVRHPALWPWLSLLLAALGLTAVIAWQIRPRPGDTTRVGPGPLLPQPSSRSAAAEYRRIRLFFPQDSRDSLKEQEKEIPRRATLVEEVRATVQELTGGDLTGSRPLIPLGTELRQVFLDGFGILYLDFSKGFQVVVAASGIQPELAISAIVTTLTTSFSEIKRVQFLIEGQEMTAGVGGWDLRRPVGPRFPGEEPPPLLSQPRE